MERHRTLVELIPAKRKENELMKKEGEISIVIKINTLHRFEEILEKRIIPLKKKYPYADIHIEVSG